MIFVHRILFNVKKVSAFFFLFFSFGCLGILGALHNNTSRQSLLENVIFLTQKVIAHNVCVCAIIKNVKLTFCVIYCHHKYHILYIVTNKPTKLISHICHEP